MMSRQLSWWVIRCHD